MSFGVVPRCGGPCTTSSDVGHSQSRVSPIGRRCRARRSISKQTRRRPCGEITELDRWFFQPRELQVRYPNNARGLCCRTHWEPVFLASRGKAGISAGFDNLAIAVLIPSRSLIMRMHVGNTERLHRHPIPLCHAKEGVPQHIIHTRNSECRTPLLHSCKHRQSLIFKTTLFTRNMARRPHVSIKRIIACERGIKTPPRWYQLAKNESPSFVPLRGKRASSGKMKVVNS